MAVKISSTLLKPLFHDDTFFTVDSKMNLATFQQVSYAG